MRGLILALWLAAAGCSDAAAGDSDAAAVDESGSGLQAQGCIDDVDPGHHEFECGEITYDVAVPDSCEDAPCGLIMDVHGWFMDGPGEANETNLDDLGSEAGYVVVHPTATLQPGRLTPEPEHSWRDDKDDENLFEFLTLAMDAFAIDEDRVHITGFSQGGAMTWRMVCDHADLFASVAPGGFAVLGSSSGICEGDRMPEPAVPIIFLHGTQDALSPHAQAATTSHAIVKGWDMQQDEVLSEDDEHTWTRFVNDDGLVHEFVEHDYASSFSFLVGHCFPGSDAGSILSCRDESAFHWGEILLQFFIDHPKD